jgi:TrpR-related protein YerC/YecD
MDEKMKNAPLEDLFRAILTLENVEECQGFFGDLCTVQELRAMSQRYQVAVMLKEKKVYSDIVKATGASTATISRVNRSLSYGNDGYEMVLGRLKDQ